MHNKIKNIILKNKKYIYLIETILILLIFISILYITNTQKVLANKEDIKNNIMITNTTINKAKENAEGNKIYTEQEEVYTTNNNSLEVIVTAYTLSEDCCGKSIDNSLYGITATGYDLKNKSLREANAIAVDPNIIPLGSKVKIEFTNDKLNKYNGIYYAVDTGGSINGYKIDLFIGDHSNSYNEAIEFGVQKAKIQILE